MSDYQSTDPAPPKDNLSSETVNETCPENSTTLNTDSPKPTASRSYIKPVTLGLLFVLGIGATFILGGDSISGDLLKPLCPKNAISFANKITDPRGIDLIKNLQNNSADNPRALGNLDAPVQMISYSDFSCPLCVKFEKEVFPALKPLIEKGILRVEHKNLVIFDKDYNSKIPALGSEAAAVQGHFWEYVATVYGAAKEGEHPVYTKESVIALAKKAGVPDLNKFKKDLDSPSLSEKVDTETLTALQLGLPGTPFFFINNNVVNGFLPADNFTQTVCAINPKQ